jgi:hypothetical protein
MDADCYCRDRRGFTRKGYRSNRGFNRWLSLVPYGMWTCEDGREVLFNRVYAPIAERASPTSQARRRPDIYFFFVSPLFALASSFNRFS